MPQILAVDIAACNGVVHVVSEVLLPFVVEVTPTDMPVTSPPATDPPVDVPVESPSSSFPSDLPSLSPSVGGDEACATVTRIACETDATSTLCELIQQYGLDEALSEGLWTVFAPTNDAFSAIASVIPTLTPEQITDVLLFHAVPEEELLSTNLECSQVRLVLCLLTIISNLFIPFVLVTSTSLRFLSCLFRFITLIVTDNGKW